MCVFVCLDAGTPKEDTDSVAISQETQSSRPKLLRLTSVTDHPEAFSEMGEMEKVFCYNKLDKLMGLLALMLPIDMQVCFFCANLYITLVQVHRVTSNSSCMYMVLRI